MHGNKDIVVSPINELIRSQNICPMLQLIVYPTIYQITELSINTLMAIPEARKKYSLMRVSRGQIVKE